MQFRFLLSSSGHTKQKFGFSAANSCRFRLLRRLRLCRILWWLHWSGWWLGVCGLRLLRRRAGSDGSVVLWTRFVWFDSGARCSRARRALHRILRATRRGSGSSVLFLLLTSQFSGGFLSGNCEIRTSSSLLATPALWRIIFDATIPTGRLV